MTVIFDRSGSSFCSFCTHSKSRLHSIDIKVCHENSMFIILMLILFSPSCSCLICLYFTFIIIELEENDDVNIILESEKVMRINFHIFSISYFKHFQLSCLFNFPSIFFCILKLNANFRQEPGP